MLNRIKLLGLCGDKLILDICDSLIQKQAPQTLKPELDPSLAQETKEKAAKPSKAQKDKSQSNKTFAVSDIVQELRVNV